MPQALPLATKIAASSSSTPVYKIISAQFGDGFSQRAAAGLNAKIDQWTINWIPLLQADKNTITAALDAVGGWDYLTWTPPGEATAKKFIVVGGYSLSFIYNYYQLSVKLQQVFDT